jgi:hypothetical protein
MALTWNSGPFERYLEAELGRRLDAAAIEVQSHTRTLLSKDGTGKRKNRVRNKAGKLVKSKKLVYNANPSKPGDPPALQTGRLRGSIAWDKPSLYVRRVGPGVKYGRPLELGSPKTHLLPRPFMVRALKERVARIRALMRRPLTGI